MEKKSSHLALLHLLSVCCTFNFNILYALLCSLVTSIWFCCDVFNMSVYVTWRVRSQYRHVFLCSSVPFRMKLRQLTGPSSCWRAFFEFEQVTLLLEVVAFICQRDHTACSSIPRSSTDWFASVLFCFARFLNCIDWDKQIHFYAFLKSWFRCII